MNFNSLQRFYPTKCLIDPDACNALLVLCCDVNTMFRELGVKV